MRPQVLPILVVVMATACLGACARLAAQDAESTADELEVVDCLLPGQRKRIGNKFSFIGPRRPARMVAVECTIRGGEYTEFDRADIATATAVWLAKAEDGDADAQNYLGEIYERGLGGERDFVEAAKWYELAANQGHASAQFNLGKLHETGQGLQPDPEKALYWYRKASNLPDLQATPELVPEPLPGEFPDSAAANAPIIELIDPQVPHTRGVNVATVSASIVERLIIGRVRAQANILSVVVNDLEVDVEDSGIFQARIPIGAGGARVTVVAVDELGRRGSRAFVLQSANDEPLQVDTDFGNYHALVIGINEYQHMNTLSTAVNDATVISRLLKDRYGFKVTFLPDADRDQIVGALNILRKSLTEDDNLLIYYAGHGTLDETNDRGHWLPKDAMEDDTTKWISNITLTDLINIMAARHVLVISDSCYAGALTRTTATSLRSGRTVQQRAADYIALNKKRSRTALTSGGLMPVLDRGRNGHSVFANALIDALQNNAEIIDGQRLMLQIRSRVAQAAFDRERFEQVPVYAPINMAGHQFGEFFFVPK